MRILFLGSDDFSTSMLKTIAKFSKIKLDVLGPSADKTFYNSKNVKTEVIPKIAEYTTKHKISYSHDINTYKRDIIDRKYDMLITASYNAFIDKSVINKFPVNRCINIHPSLLPYYKGAAPIQRTLLNNAELTGVTVQTLHPEKFDHGKILLQSSPILTSDLCDESKKVAWKTLYKMNNVLVSRDEGFDAEEMAARGIHNDDKTGIHFSEEYSTLRNSLTIVGNKLIHELFTNDNYDNITPSDNDKLISGDTLEYKTFSSKLNILDFDIKWKSKTASELEYISSVTNERIYTHFKRVPRKNIFKQPWTPEKIFLNDLKSLNGYLPLNKHLEVGMFEIRENKIIIKCKDDTYVECERVRPADKHDFITVPEFEKLIKKHYRQTHLKFESFNEIINEYKTLNETVHIPAVESMIRLKASLKNKNNVKKLTIDNTI